MSVVFKPSLIERVLRGTVCLSTKFVENGVVTKSGGGAAVLLDRDGHVLTNAHVVASRFPVCKGVRSLKDLSSDQLDYDFRAGRVVANFLGAEPTIAKVLKVDLINDTALLKISRSVIRTINEPLVFSDVVPEPGAPLLLAGHPTGLPFSVRFGHLISASRSLNDFDVNLRKTFPQGYFPSLVVKMLELDIRGAPGCSGGPLALLDGRLLGLLNSGIHDVRMQGFNACYGIPAAVVLASIENMFSGAWKGVFYPSISQAGEGAGKGAAGKGEGAAGKGEGAAGSLLYNEV